MKRVKKRTYSGIVLEQEIYPIAERAKVSASPRFRFSTDEERQAHKDGISRRKHARQINATYGPSSLYSTLTFSVENEVHTYREAKEIRDKFYRRLLYKYPDAKINLYIGRGKSTDRYHIHMLSDGIPEEYIKKQWKYGEIVRIENLRQHNFYNGIDYGRDYTGLANYLFDHWRPEFGGHRWKASRNVAKPEEEAPKEIKRNYSAEKPPKTPTGYRLVEVTITRYGYMNFKYVKEERGAVGVTPFVSLVNV